MENVYILEGARTPIGSFMGGLSSVPAPELGGHAIKAALEKAELAADKVDNVFMGNVVSAGLGQAPARQASLAAGLSQMTPCVTVNKVCGSGLQTIIFGAQQIALREAGVVVAGGMENMSMAPHLLVNSRQGYRFGPQEIRDAMQWDGLWDVYSNRPMGNCAEECAEKYRFTREQQDEFAMTSFKRSRQAQQSGVFKTEISPLEVRSRKTSTLVEHDEGPGKANFDKIPKLKPAFEKDGTITAANASSINDGAASVVLAGEEYRDRAKFRIVSYAQHAHDPTWFTTAPLTAFRHSLDKAKLKPEQIDLFEVNEAFAVVPMSFMKEFNLTSDKMNIYGGAVSLGHPIGCSGTRIVVTLMNALEREDKRIGCAAICIGGGEALSLIIERL